MKGDRMNSEVTRYCAIDPILHRDPNGGQQVRFWPKHVPINALNNIHTKCLIRNVYANTEW